MISSTIWRPTIGSVMLAASWGTVPALAQGAPNASDIPDARAIAGFADHYFAAALAEEATPGAVVAIVLDGRVTHLAGYGTADRKNNTPMNPERTLMRLGSVSKALTAVVAVAAAEHAIVRLHDDVWPLLARAAIDMPSASHPFLYDPGGPVTLHDFLTHTSGYSNRLLGQRAESTEEWRGLSEFLTGNGPLALLEPGTAVIYSDIGMSLAGAVLELAAGVPFPALAKRLVFAPAGMIGTTFDPRLPAELQSELAQGYLWRGDLLTPVPYDYVMTTPALGAVSTAADMGRLMSLLLTGGGGMVGADSAALLMSRQETNYRGMRGRAYGFSEGNTVGRTAWFHDGMDPGFTAHVSLVPELGLGVFVAANGATTMGLGALSPTGRIIREFVGDLILELWPAVSAPIPELVLLSPDDRADYAAFYREASLDRDTPLKVQGLIEQVLVLPVSDVRLSFLGQTYRKIALDVFQSEDDPSRHLRFLRDYSGSISHMLLPNVTFERVRAWESVQVQVIVAGLALGLLMLGTIIVVMALAMGWWGRLANGVGLLAGCGGLGLALWFVWRLAVFNLDVVMVHGLFGLPFPAVLWVPLAAAAALSFLFALFGRGIHAINRWGLVFIAVGWTAYIPVLKTWQLLA